MANLFFLFCIFATSICFSNELYKGFQINVSEKAVLIPETKEAITIIKSQIDKALLFSTEFKKLQFKIQFWLTDNQWQRSAAATHVSREWLVQNQMNPAMYNGIEITNVKNFVLWTKKYQPYMTLHELAHAYQFNFLGWSNQNILNAYENAVTLKLYESVPYLTIDGPKKLAYARTNEHEYFSELTEAYFGKNEFYPFEKTQLRNYDSVGFNMLKKIWKN